MYQTHLSKEFENQQQANNKTKKKHSVTNNMKTDESNNKHNQLYPSNKKKNVSKIVSTQMAQKKFIKQRIWDEENTTHTFSWWFWEEMKQQWSLKMGTQSV